MTAYYNEIDPYAAQWLRNLIAAGHIAQGEVDERSIEDVCPNDIRGFTQCHFFAGIGVWSYALRQAGWPDDREIWTGSCPCQPFSAAGAGAGFADERHLWPAFHHLIRECRPRTIFGEQVSSKDAEPWVNLVQADLEGVGYRVAALAFPSACVGAPHIRDRLYWMGHASGAGLERHAWHGGATGWQGSTGSTAATSVPIGLAHAQCHGGGRQTTTADYIGTETDRPANRHSGCGGASGGMANTKGAGSSHGREGAIFPIASKGGGNDASWLADAIMQQRPDGQPGIGLVDDARGWIESAAAPSGLRGNLRPGPVNGFWRDADWLGCRDGKWRPVEPGTFPLAHGVAARVGQLRAYGNAINAQAAKIFIESAMSYLP